MHLLLVLILTMFNRKKTTFLVVFIAVIIGLVLAWFFIKPKQNTSSIDWTNPDSIFALDIPDDFNEDKIERLQSKIDNARQLLEEKPEDNWTFATIGNMYEFVRDYDRALLAYQKSLTIQPNDITSMLSIATIYTNYQPNFKEAEKYYSRAIGIFPQLPDLYNRLARLYWLKMDRLEDAEIIFLQGVENSQEHSDALVNLIGFYERTDQINKQKTHVTRLLELYPDEELYQQEWGHLIE